MLFCYEVYTVCMWLLVHVDGLHKLFSQGTIVGTHFLLCICRAHHSIPLPVFFSPNQRVQGGSHLPFLVCTTMRDASPLDQVHRLV